MRNLHETEGIEFGNLPDTQKFDLTKQVRYCGYTVKGIFVHDHGGGKHRNMVFNAELNRFVELDTKIDGNLDLKTWAREGSIITNKITRGGITLAPDQKAIHRHNGTKNYGVYEFEIVESKKA